MDRSDLPLTVGVIGIVLLLAGIIASIHHGLQDAPEPQLSIPSRPGDCYMPNSYPVSQVEAEIMAGKWHYVPRYHPHRLRIALLVSEGRAAVAQLDIVCGDPVAGTSEPQRLWYWRCIDAKGCG
jgi:hypothetical protein